MNQDKNNLEHCQGKKVIYEVPICFKYCSQYRKNTP